MSASSIRRLAPGDIGAARALNVLYADAFEDPERYADAPPDDDWVAALLARPEFIALVAEADGMIVGGATAYVLHKLERATSELYLYDIAVADDWRRRGIGTGLIRALNEIGGQVGASSLYVQADPEDGPAVSLYSGLGKRADVFHFDLLPDGD